MMKTVVLILVIICLCVSARGVPTDHHQIIVGHIYPPYEVDSTVTFSNIRTGEQLQVTAIDCEHSLKEYLFNMANLKQGWKSGDLITISYGNEFATSNLDESKRNIQVDINAPADYSPIIIGGAVLIAASGGLYYRKKKGANIMEDNDKPTEEPVSETKSIVDYIFGGTKKALIMIMLLTIVIGILAGKAIPAEFIEMATYLIMIYFGAGGVKLGMEMKSK